MSDAHQFLTPVGRLVSGSFFEPQKTDHMNKPLTEDKWSYFVALAFPKTATQWHEEQGELGAVFNALRAAANDGYRGQEWQNAAFKWKLEDGDSPKHAEKTGWKGHWVLKFNRSHRIDRCPLYDNNNPPQHITESSRAKRGDYYRISGSTTPNGAVGDQAGVYVNMNMAQWCAHGEEIASGPSATQVFGGAPTALPPGASTTPSAPAAGMPAAPQGQPQAAPSAPPQAPAQTPAPAAPTAAPSAPPQAPASPAPTAAPTPGAVPPPSFADGGGYDGLPEKFQYQGAAYTKEQLLAAGHTEEMIATYPKA